MDVKQWERMISNSGRKIPKLLSAANQKIASKVIKLLLVSYDRGGYKPGASFVPWAKRRYTYKHKILNKTGHLRGSYRVESVSGSRVVIVNDAEYAQYVNDGTDNNPARPLFYDSKDINVLVEELVVEAMLKAFKY